MIDTTKVTISELIQNRVSKLASEYNELYPEYKATGKNAVRINEITKMLKELGFAMKSNEEPKKMYTLQATYRRSCVSGKKTALYMNIFHTKKEAEDCIESYTKELLSTPRGVFGNVEDVNIEVIDFNVK